MAYQVPGRADDLPEALVERWNATIGKNYTDLFERLGSRFITPDPRTVERPEDVAVHWFADPAEPVTCFDRVVARQLADWPRGRATVQDEYAEYAIERRPGRDGTLRPKRVQITTELREYWRTVAAADPEAFAAMAEDVLGRRPAWTELYGVEDPRDLEEAQREALFDRMVAGVDGTPPEGELNTTNALFMTNRINGLGDLIYIVMFGAHPYVVDLPDGSRREATRDELFALETTGKELACRHADPVAAQAAHAAALQGRAVAFADPLGMYIQTFDATALTVDGGPLPDTWVQWARGEEGMRQRLVVGPPDDDARFLDDITVSVGAADEPLVGGFQLLQLIELGPLVVQGPRSEVADEEFVSVAAANQAIDCTAEFVCGPIRELKELFDREQRIRRTGRRSLGPFDG